MKAIKIIIPVVVLYSKKDKSVNATTPIFDIKINSVHIADPNTQLSKSVLLTKYHHAKKRHSFGNSMVLVGIVPSRISFKGAVLSLSSKFDPQLLLGEGGQ